MSPRLRIALLTCAASLALPAAALASHSVGTSSQISWVRTATTRFVTAELKRDPAEACAVLTAKQRATVDRRTCEQRWGSKIKTMLHEPGERALLQADRHAIATAAVIVHGNVASIELPTPLLNGSNELLWTENCWMVKG
jgi:hypothetical protein